uniref:Uncharacterized protein n=1 Tax=Capitella teleta TaxID=283909 RepID=X2B605_CAPTE
MEPIHRACREGVLHKVNEILKQKNPNLLITDAKRYNALHWACVNGVIEIVQLLIDLQKYTQPASDSAEPVTPNDMTPLMLASFREKSQSVDVLLKHNADPNEMDSTENTALHMAAMRGNQQIAQLLLKAKALVDARNKEGKTP